MLNKFRLAAFADEASAKIDEQIAAMKKNGVEFLEIRNVDGTNIANIDAKKAKEVREKLDAAGLAVWSMGSPVGKTKIQDDFAFESEQFKNVLECAGILGAKCIRLFSFYGTEGKPEYRDEVLSRLAEYVDMAKGSGITLCHENEKGIYGDIAVRCDEIHRAIPEIKAVFDPANFIQSNQDTMEAWEMLKKYVFYFHIKDCLADGNVVPAGKGIARLDEILPDYNGLASNILTIEPHLKVFAGLAGLEGGERSEVGKLYSFSSNAEAFDCAVNSLKEIIKNI